MEKCIKRSSKIKAIVCAIVMVVVIGLTGAYASGLSDIQNHWSKEYVEYLTNKGAINGYPDGTFRPEEKVTYAEAIKLIVASYNKGIENGQEHWAQNYVDYARQTGIVPNNMFRDSQLDEAISRKEVIYMVYQSITEYAKKPLVNNDRTEIDLPFSDLDITVNKYGINYYEAVRQSYYLGILTGDDEGLMNPEDNITRAEMATILTRAYSESYRQYPSTRAKAYLPSNADDYAIVLAYMPNSFYEAGSETFAKYKKGGTPSSYLYGNRYIQWEDGIIAGTAELFNVSYKMTEEEWNRWKESMRIYKDVTEGILNGYIQYVKDNNIEVRGGTIINPCTIGDTKVVGNRYELAIKGIMSYEIISKNEDTKYITLDEYMYEKQKLKEGNEEYILIYFEDVGDENNIIMEAKLKEMKYERE